MNRLAAVTTAFLLSSACLQPASHGETIVFTPCSDTYVEALPGSSDDARASIQTAVEMWRLLNLPTLTGSPTPEAEMIPVRFRDAPDLFHGVYEEARGEIVINSRLAGRAQAVTVAHELGHAMGLEHVPASARRSVMNPGNTDHAPDEEDRQALGARWRECLSSPLEPTSP